MFFGRQNGLKNTIILFFNIKKPLLLLKTVKTVQDKHIEQAKKAIKKHKPELGKG